MAVQREVQHEDLSPDTIYPTSKELLRPRK
jgi:hypothetical protein